MDFSATRRDFLLAAAGVGVGAAWPAQGRTAPRRPALVLVHLKGGNDGLNTVVPWRDPSYRRLRPALALPTDALLRLSDDVALHPALEPLMPAWKDGELAIVQNVGYPEATRSHFTSTDVWSTASPGLHTSRGWVGAVLARSPRDPRAVADAISLAEHEGASLQAPGIRTLTLSRPRKWLQRAGAVPDRRLMQDVEQSASLSHLLATENDIVMARERLRAQLLAAPREHRAGKANKTFSGVSLASRLLHARYGIRAVHLEIGGFDTHANQAGRHQRVLGRLALGLASLRAGLVAHGQWKDTVIMVYSEFGRRVQENGSRGTDHGKAGPMFILGGGLRGGLYGGRTSLDDLDDGDLRFTTDFRQVYGTVARDLLGYPATAVHDVLGSHARLGFAA